MTDKLWTVYVIRNPSGVLYTGIAKAPKARINAHNAGQGAKFTKGRGPWACVHAEGPMSHGDALRRELSIKKDRTLKQTLKSGVPINI